MKEGNYKSKVKNNRYKILGIIFVLIGIFLSSMPIHNSKIEKEYNIGILEGVATPEHIYYPHFSYYHELIISLFTNNGTFTLLVLDEEAYTNWINDKWFHAALWKVNITGIFWNNDRLDMWGRKLHVLIIPESYVEIQGLVYSSYYLPNFFGNILLLIGTGIFVKLYINNRNKEKPDERDGFYPF
jgi:hypothetical protein